MISEKNDDIRNSDPTLSASSVIKRRCDSNTKTEIRKSPKVFEPSAADSPHTYRLAKFLADRNLCSRRDAERHILNGDVSVNGVKVFTPVFFVNDSDTVFFCGDRAEEKPPAKLWIYHKRVGEITTHKDPQKRTTVFEAVAARHGLHQVLSVGRLDINSEGLLLLTNHNSIAHEFETAHVERVYKVRVFGRIEMLLSSRYAHTLSGEGDNVTSIELRNVSINGTKYAPILIRFSMPIHTKNVQQNFWISVSLYEGKNREIRKILALLGLQVNRLIRTKFGTFELGDLPLGALQEVPTASLRIAASGTVNELATN